MPTFNAIDVETANSDRGSLCQIGIVHVVEGKIADQWSTLVNPEARFDHWNVAIHGITEHDVLDSPAIPELRGELNQRLHGSTLVSHTSFDRGALDRAMARYGLEQLKVTWLDSARIARRAWSDKYGSGGWGLKNIAGNLGIRFNHHDALEDARAAAQIVLHACADTGMDIADWLHQVERPISSRPRRKISVQASASGVLHGETVLFTGRLSAARHEMAGLAARAGCAVASAASGKVSILVVGNLERVKLDRGKMSSKHRRVTELIAGGKEIRILSETEFFQLAGFDIRNEG